MAFIQRLPDNLISQIAAGEVIERPASVVKELVENAIDAQATRIEVELFEGGLNQIVVTDNGVGMSAEDARLAIERHATSKLRQAEDLFNIRTLGFRGEALPSIASVSRFELTTRAKTSDLATVIKVTGGEALAEEQNGAPFGTRMVVRDLFFNQPARRKFQKTPATEQSHAVEAVLRIGLSTPQTRLVVKNGDRRLLDIPSISDTSNTEKESAHHFAQKQRLAVALGLENIERLYPLEAGAEDLKLTGYIADPEVQSSDGRHIFTYVNGRFIRDRMLQRAILEGYRSLLPHGRYPTAVLFLTISSGDVDVNVHPQKFEVRFKDSHKVFRLVMQTLSLSLAHTPWLSTSGAQIEPPQIASQKTAALPFIPPIPFVAHSTSWKGLLSPSSSPSLFTNAIPVTSDSISSQVPNSFAFAKGGFFSRLRVIAQFANLYLLCEGDQHELVIIDQHAAHERITFEKLLTQWQEGHVISQRLLLPLTLHTSPSILELLDEHHEELERLGLELSPFGDNTVALTAIPAISHEANAKTLAESALAELNETQRSAGAEFTHQLLARIACHSAVRAGDTLSIPEQEALLAALDPIDCNVRCPHGRPVVARMTLETISRLFERT